MPNKQLTIVVTVVIGILLLILGFSRSIFFTLRPGERAVVFRRFSDGLDKKNVLQPGFHTKSPWNEIYVYDVTENKIEETLDVLDKNGLAINVDISVRFHPMYEKIGDIYEVFQQDYINRLVIPEVRSTVRQVMGRYSAEEIYSTQRPQVEAAMSKETEETLGEEGNNVVMRALLIRSITLPEQIRLAIENKLKQEQEALAYQFKLEKEKSEAERRRIAAKGEAAANHIVNSSLTNMLLKMRGIEATASLSESPNSKVVIIGSGKDGLPIILGNN